MIAMTPLEIALSAIIAGCMTCGALCLIVFLATGKDKCEACGEPDAEHKARREREKAEFTRLLREYGNDAYRLGAYGDCAKPEHVKAKNNSEHRLIEAVFGEDGK